MVKITANEAARIFKGLMATPPRNIKEALEKEPERSEEHVLQMLYQKGVFDSLDPNRMSGEWALVGISIVSASRVVNIYRKVHGEGVVPTRAYIMKSPKRERNRRVLKIDGPDADGLFEFSFVSVEEMEREIEGMLEDAPAAATFGNGSADGIFEVVSKDAVMERSEMFDKVSEMHVAFDGEKTVRAQIALVAAISAPRVIIETVKRTGIVLKRITEKGRRLIVFSPVKRSCGLFDDGAAFVKAAFWRYKAIGDGRFAFDLFGTVDKSSFWDVVIGEPKKKERVRVVA